VHDDLYANVTTRIVAALEEGVAPWVRPWSTIADTLPMNLGSRRVYRAINVVLLGPEAQVHGYALNRWLTYRQAGELGGQVRRGEHGIAVVFWKLRKVTHRKSHKRPVWGRPAVNRCMSVSLRVSAVHYLIRTRFWVGLQVLATKHQGLAMGGLVDWARASSVLAPLPRRAQEGTT